jgi:hypothetical protein
MPRPRTQSAADILPDPRIDDVVPPAALPLGEVELIGAHLGPFAFGPPAVLVDGHPAQVLMSRPTRLALRVPEQASTGLVEVRSPSGASNAAPLRVAHQLSAGLHPVTSPAVSRSGMIYATISGPRGKQTPVSVVRVSPDGRGTPFVTGILNATGLAFNPEGDLFVTSRAEGNVYRIDPSGESTVYAEGMGVATGAVFDVQGNLFVGDRSGTIFKIDPERQIFVYATLEPSPAAYHLALNAEGVLFVTAPARCHLDRWHPRSGNRLVSRPRPTPWPRALQGRRRLCCRLSPWPPRPGPHYPRRRCNPRPRRTQPRRRRLFSPRHHHSRHQRSRL